MSILFFGVHISTRWCLQSQSCIYNGPRQNNRTTQISWQPALSLLPSYQINISILTTMELSLQKRVCKFVFTTQGFKVTWLRYKYFQCTLKTLTILHFFQVVPNFLSLTETSRCLLSLVLVLGVFSNLTCATEEEDEKGN